MFTPFSRSSCLAIAFTLIGAVASAQTLTPLESAMPETTVAPYSLFQYAAITGSGNSLSASYIPVVLANGTTIYKNLSINFNVDSLGNLTIASGYPVVSTAQSPLVSAFQSGTYVGPSANYPFAITVAGPSTTSGGATEWSSSTPTGTTNCTEPLTATWYVGPLTSSPIYPRLKAAGITSTAWSYGVSSSNGCHDYWSTDTLIGVSQIGNSIVFVSLTDYDGNDHNLPQDTITYTKH